MLLLLLLRLRAAGKGVGSSGVARCAAQRGAYATYR